MASRTESSIPPRLTYQPIARIRMREGHILDIRMPALHPHLHISAFPFVDYRSVLNLIRALTFLIADSPIR